MLINAFTPLLSVMFTTSGKYLVFVKGGRFPTEDGPLAGAIIVVQYNSQVHNKI